MGICGVAIFLCGVAVNKIPSCGFAAISNRTVCGVFYFEATMFGEKYDLCARCCGLFFDTFDRLTRTLVRLVELSKPIIFVKPSFVTFWEQRHYQIC